MEARLNAHCWVCGKAYYKCTKCNSMGHWKTVADNPNCYQIYLVIDEYENKVIDAKAAAEMLAKCGVKEDNLGDILPEIADIIKKIFADAKSKKVK